MLMLTHPFISDFFDFCFIPECLTMTAVNFIYAVAFVVHMRYETIKILLKYFKLDEGREVMIFCFPYFYSTNYLRGAEFIWFGHSLLSVRKYWDFPYFGGNI